MTSTHSKRSTLQDLEIDLPIHIEEMSEIEEE